MDWTFDQLVQINWYEASSSPLSLRSIGAKGAGSPSVSGGRRANNLQQCYPTKEWLTGPNSMNFPKTSKRPLTQGWGGMTFGHLGTGTGMAQPIPKLWEREREWKISFPTFGNGNGKIPFPIFGNGNGNSIPAFREREWDIVIPGHDREWEWELHRKIEWKFFIIPLFNPTNILHCNRLLICS